MDTRRSLIVFCAVLIFKSNLSNGASTITYAHHDQHEKNGDPVKRMTDLELAPDPRSQHHKSEGDMDDGMMKVPVLAGISGFNFSDGAYLMSDCHIGPETQVQDLDNECQLIKQFNQTALDEMIHNEMIDLVSYCACQLANMYHFWELSFDATTSTRRVATMVNRVLSKSSTKGARGGGHPDYLWSDIDVTIYQVSIYTATSDYFYQQMHNKSSLLPVKLRAELNEDEVWRLIWQVCLMVAKDPYHVYRYMENINRASPPVFFNLLQMSDAVSTAYEASKACKLPLMLQFENYKFKAGQSNDRFLNPISGLIKTTDGSYSGPVATGDLDSMLLTSGVSPLLLKCSSWQENRPTIGNDNHESTGSSTSDCSIMLSETPPVQWIEKHSSPLDRSLAAIKCGCQLLRHNATWVRIMHDPNVAVMSKALTNYMNRNQVPDFVNTPIWSLYGWFQSIMDRFVNNRKATIKEVVKTLSGDQDPLEMKSRMDSVVALELSRRACNYIVFNYNKGSKEQQIDLKSIKYLDNLQLISQDPMFVFHLTLQDPNLFKLHALSKMCIPFVT